MITQNRSDWLRAMQDHLRGPTCRFLDATQNKLQLHHCKIIIVQVKLFQNIIPFFSKGTRRELLLQWPKSASTCPKKPTKSHLKLVVWLQRRHHFQFIRVRRFHCANRHLREFSNLHPALSQVSREIICRKMTDSISHRTDGSCWIGPPPSVTLTVLKEPHGYTSNRLYFRTGKLMFCSIQM